MPSESMRGRLLVATPALREPTFAQTVILLLEHSDTTGALGVVINRPSDTGVIEVVPAVADLVTDPPALFVGGPVSPSTAIGIGLVAPGVAAEGCTPLAPPLVSVDLDHDPSSLATSLRALRVFVGYAGWSPGQLEGELAEGSWYLVDSLPTDPFSRHPHRVRADVLRRQGWPLAAAAHAPLDPALN